MPNKKSKIKELSTSSYEPPRVWGPCPNLSLDKFKNLSNWSTCLANIKGHEIVNHIQGEHYEWYLLQHYPNLPGQIQCLMRIKTWWNSTPVNLSRAWSGENLNHAWSLTFFMKFLQIYRNMCNTCLFLKPLLFSLFLSYIISHVK